MQISSHGVWSANPSATPSSPTNFQFYTDQKSEFTDEQRLAAIRRRILRKEKEKNAKKRKQQQEAKKRLRPAWIVEKRKSNRSPRHKNESSSKYKKEYSRTLNVHIIETEEETDATIQKLKYTECVGFDCEGVITLGRTGKLSLIQVSDDKNIYLFDILKMNYKIPQSLSEWLESDNCSKFIHDSRQDQDALYHCHGVSLGGIFDTTVANLVYRVWIGKSRPCGRLIGMDALALDIIHKAGEYKVLFNINLAQTGKYLKLTDLQKKKKNENQTGTDSDDSPAETAEEKEKKWKKIKVNCFDQKQGTKAMMRADAKLWAYRPMAINLVIYAAVDGYVSLLMGQYFRRKFKQWMIDKTLFVSAKWCRSVARQTRVRGSSSKVPNSIVKLIRSNTADMDINGIPDIGQKFRCKQQREEAEKGKDKVRENEEDVHHIEFDNLLLMAERIDFIPRRLKEKMNPNADNHEKGIMDYMTDIYKLDYDTEDHSSYVRVGKLNYSRLIPLKLIENERNNL